MRYIKTFQILTALALGLGNGELNVNRTWLRTNVAPLLRQALVFTLSLSLSGLLPVLGQIQQARADVTSLIRAAIEEGDQIDKQLKMQIRRSRHPGTPGTAKGFTTPPELALLEARFKLWKTQLEHLISLPQEPERHGGDSTSVAVKVSAINRYLQEVAQLTSLRIALGLPHGPSWSKELELAVPQSTLPEISIPTTKEPNRFGERFSPMIIDRGAEGSSVARIKLSARLIQGLELARLSDVQNDDTNLTMIKYLATRQLLSNLNDIRFVSSNHPIDFPQIPARFRSKLESMGLASEIAEEQYRAIAERGSRFALLQTIDSIGASLPPFVTHELIEGITAVIVPNKKQRKSAQSPIQELFSAAESKGLTKMIEGEIDATTTPFSTQSATRLGDTLRAVLSSAKARTQLNKFFELMTNEGLYLSLESRRTIMALIDERRASYEAGIPSELILAWQTAAKSLSEDLLFGEQRRNFVQDVLYRAPEAVSSTRQSFSGDVIDPSLLSQVFAVDLAKLSPSDAASAWFYEIRTAGTYLSARAKYNEIVQREISPGLMTGGIINGPKALAIVNTRDFTPKEIPVTENTDPRLADRIRARMGHSRRADLLALIQYGDWMGFHRVYLKHNPSVSDVLEKDVQVPSYFSKMFPEAVSKLGKSRISEYFAHIDAAATNRYPILAVKIPYKMVTRKTGWHKASKHELEDGDYDSGSGDRLIYGEYDEINHEPRLADALVGLNAGATCDEATEARAAELIDMALVKIEEQIRKNIEKIGNAKNAGEIEKVVTTSMMLSLVMNGFPEFRLYEERFLEELLSPSLIDQVMHKYAGPAMMYGFGAMMLIKGVNWIAKKAIKRAFPITHIFSLGFDSLVAGYMHGAMYLIVADTVYQINETLHQGKQRQQQEDFFFCAVEGSCFTEISELRAANMNYEFSKWMLYGRLAMDTMLMYLPVGRGKFTQWRERISLKEFTADGQAFEKFGLKPGDFNKVERAMKLARMVREKRALGPDFVIAAEGGNPGMYNGAGWVHVAQGERVKLGHELSYPSEVSGLISIADLEILSKLVPQFVHDGTSGIMSLASAEGWGQLEQSYARLSGKIAAGMAYRLPTVVERMAVEDAFHALELPPGKLKSWEMIEDARALHEKAAPDHESASRINRAARFLTQYRATSPNVTQQGLLEVSSAERRLFKILKRAYPAEAYWSTFELLEEANALSRSSSLPAPPAGGNK